jgi:hypothetical protein
MTLFILEKFSGGRNYCWLKNVGAISSSAYGGEGTAFSGPGKFRRDLSFISVYHFRKIVFHFK